MGRRTKIVCTLGPASSDGDTIRGLVAAGMDVARLNFSHGSHEDHRRLVGYVREAAEREGRTVPILQDLQGPKIRVGPMANGGVPLRRGQRLVLTTQPIEESSGERVYVNYPTLAEDVEPGNRILLDDGLLELKILEAGGTDVLTEVVTGGPLRSRKGVNLPDIRTTTPSLTEKDLRDLAFGLEMDVDLIALSFVRRRSDVEDLCRRIQAAGKKVGVISKVEKPEAVRDIHGIIAASDGVMVARGDLGIEMPMERVPSTQKMIIRKCLEAAKPVITATQMLESMIENPRPTRAEASDVANAVLDGSDAVMLSGETATGRHPCRVVEVMAQIIEEAERHYGAFTFEPNRDGRREEHVTESVSTVACELAEKVGAAGIACLTSSGATARSIARHRPSMPVYAFTDEERVVGQLGLLWGTKAFVIPFQRDTDRGVQMVHDRLHEGGLIASGDLLVITAGMPLPARGRTNMVHVSQV